MKILNLTQHKASSDQIAAGVVDLPEDARSKLLEILTFDDIPSRTELESRSWKVMNLVADDNENLNIANITSVMIGGAPFFMSHLEFVFEHHNPCYAFSKREVQEIRQEDGSVKKTAVFRHLGFVPAG